MKKTLFIIILIFSMIGIVYAVDQKLTALTELTAIADTDIIYVVDDPGGTPLSKKITILNLFDTIDTFSELNTIVADKTLVNEEDAVAWDALGTFALGITITTGDPFTLGTTRWDNGSDKMDGEQIADDTIDNDSIDWGDMTDLTTDGAVSWGNITAGEYPDDTVNNDDINWADIDNLGDEGAVTLAGLATTLTITDNESTAENNPIVFVENGDLDGGNLGLESDGTCYYTPSTGVITTTGFAGALTGNASTATLAATVTYADNENTAETNAIVFLPGGDLDGGNLAPEVDGDFHYNPSTGTVTTTQFVGGGAGVTSVDAITGDSATAFFDAGTIEHEYGGLEADINAYTGLVAITGGATAEVDSKSELEGHIADVADFAEADGDTWTGVHDFGGATSLEIPNATDPDVDAVGEISMDTDGADEPNDVTLRVFEGDVQYAIARVLKTIQCTIIKPNDLANATRDACPIWSNETGMTFTVTKIEAWSDTDDTVLNVEEEDADGANNASVDELTIATDGTGMYYTTETTITGATIEANHILLLDFDDTDDPGWVKISICGWFNADVD